MINIRGKFLGLSINFWENDYLKKNIIKFVTFLTNILKRREKNFFK